MSLELTPAAFDWFRQSVYTLAGIRLQPGKEGLVKSRLSKRLRALGISSFEQYIEHLEDKRGRLELKLMVDHLTTNKTSFFRESQHFDHMRTSLLPQLLAAKVPLKFWSAGCSSGEEPYTLAMVLHDALPDSCRDSGCILATDISARMLERARAGVYTSSVVQDVPKDLLRRHFQAVQADGKPAYRVGDSLRRMVRFAHLNLMDDWPMRGPFGAIFCRNVMIYFDRPTQERLVERFRQLLVPGGFLLIGHSESMTGLSHGYRYVRPAVYAR